MVRRVGAAPDENRAHKMKVIFPALPRRAGSASLVSLILTPKPGRRLSQYLDALAARCRWKGAKVAVG